MLRLIFAYYLYVRYSLKYQFDKSINNKILVYEKNISGILLIRFQRNKINMILFTHERSKFTLKFK